MSVFFNQSIKVLRCLTPYGNIVENVVLDNERLILNVKYINLYFLFNLVAFKLMKC